MPSSYPVYTGALLQEREVYDLMGIRFEGHPDLRRMFLWAGYPGFPLRKDFLIPDDGSRSPGMGVRYMEQPLPPAETGRVPVLRRSPGTGSLAAGHAELGGGAAPAIGSGEASA